MATSIRLDDDTERRLNYLAKLTGCSKTFYLKSLIEQGLSDMEDYCLAADVLERIRAGREQVHSAAEVRAGLGLDN